MTRQQTSPSRRRVLSALGIFGIGTLSGCDQQDQPVSSNPSPDPTESTTSTDIQTVVFTDKPATASTPSSNNSLVYDANDHLAFADALQTLAANPGSTLKIETGRYEVDPQPGLQGDTVPHIRISDLHDVNIEGNGSTLVFSDPTLAGIYFVGGSNLTIRDLTFDYEPVPFTQGTIDQVSPANRALTVMLDDGYPALDHEMFDIAPNVWASVHTADGEFIRGIRREGDPDKHFSSIVRESDRKFTLTLTDYSNLLGIQPGRRLVIVARDHFSALSFYKTDRPVLRNVTVSASKGGPFSFQVCNRPSVRNCSITPPEGSDRIIGANADGVRFNNCISKPEISNSRFEYLEDDGIVVQHTLAPVREILDESTLRIGHVHPFVVKPGDVLEVMSPGGVRKGTLPPIARMTVRQRVGGADTRAKPETVTVEDTIPESVIEGDLLGNLSTACHDFTVRGNVIRNVRGRLIRIAASRGVVTDNTLDGSQDSSIILESEGTLEPFAPKGWVMDVEVTGNTVVRPGLNYFAGKHPAGIRVDHVSPSDTETRGRPNRAILIADNEVSNGATVGLRLVDVENITVSNNQLRKLNQLEYSGFAKAGIYLQNVSKSRLQGNVVRGSGENLDQFGIQRDSDNFTVGGNDLVIDDQAVEPAILELMPVELSFNKAGQPGNRMLSFLCRNLWLLDANEEIISSVDVGSDESGVEFGPGVYSQEQHGGGSWRWFGGPSKVARLYFSQSKLDRARYLRLRGEPYENGIAMTVFVKGQQTDKIEFGPRQTSTYRIDLD